MPIYDQFSHVGGKEYCKTKAGTPPHINFCVPVIINSHRSYVKPIRFIYLQFGNQFSYELISNELLCPRQNTPLAKKLTRDVVIFSCKKKWEYQHTAQRSVTPISRPSNLQIDCTATPDTVKYRSGPPILFFQSYPKAQYLTHLIYGTRSAPCVGQMYPTEGRLWYVTKG